MITAPGYATTGSGGAGKGPLPFAHPSRSDEVTTSSRALRVLIVEDEYFVGLSAEAALLDAGHEVLAIVTKGEEGVALAIEERPDVVVMDVRLAGGIDGIDAALQLAHHGIRCIFASAHSDEQTRARGDGARPIGWVTKPYSSRDLVSAIERGLGYRRES